VFCRFSRAQSLRDIKFEIAVMADQFEVGAVRGDEPGSMGADGESDQNIEVEIAELVGLETFVSLQF
jgi:hypothetical protein